MAEAENGRRARPKFSELGSTGLHLYPGQIVTEEFQRDLQGLAGVKAFGEMITTPIPGAIAFVIEQMIMQVQWETKPFSEESKDKEPREFIDSCFEDMSQSWSETLSEICTMFTFGWAYLEVVYKMRNGMDKDPKSKFDDRKIGWRKWALRGQNTLDGWDIDENGGIKGMIQNIDWPKNEKVTIPIQKSLLFRTRTEKNNPEGQSIFRRSYRPWWMAKRSEEIEAIGMERDLGGLPVLTPPENVDLWNDNDPVMVATRLAAEKLVKSLRRGEREGVLKPFGWTLELLSSSSRRNFDTNQVITRYETRIAQSALADFIFLGSASKTGSWALSSDKTELFALAIGGYLTRIKEVINRHAIPALLELNQMDLTRPPYRDHGDIEKVDLTQLGNLLASYVSAGGMMDESLDRHVRLTAGFPPLEEGEFPKEPNTAEAQRQLREEVDRRIAAKSTRENRRVSFEALQEIREIRKAILSNGHLDLSDEIKKKILRLGIVTPDELARLELRKHYPGGHDQETHGNRGGSLADRVIQDGGFTANPVRLKDRRAPRNGYAFSIRPDTEMKLGNLPRQELKTKITQYVKQHWNDIKERGNYLGGWRDEKTGEIFVDISRVERDRSRAIQQARQAHQRAIFDLGKKKTVDLREAA